MSLPRRAGLLSAALAAGALLPIAPTGATAPPLVPCARAAASAVPSAHRLDDTPPVTAADLAALHTSARAARSLAGALPDRVTIKVRVHVIKGTRPGERVPAGPRKVHRVLRVLNRGFHGKQVRGAPRSRFSFVLRSIDYTTREGWYHAYLFGPRDLRMKHALHRGGRRTLNLYINGGGPTGLPVLGWSRFPWEYAAHPALDSVTVNWKALPGGTLRHYRHGDTVIHETGHWLGLFHTFQGGCRPPGDLVADTHAEAQPMYTCNTDRDSCSTDPGKDPVHNFMDYSYDSCMNHFTRGQLARMDASYAKYRR